MTERHYAFSADGRCFFAVRKRVRDMMEWEGRGNPWLWFSWEVLANGERDYLACGVRTLREAQEPIDKLCGITG